VKWIAIWLMVLGDTATPVNDEDAPPPFATIHECGDHLAEAGPQLEAIIRRHFPDARVIGACDPLPPQAEPQE
jgi:hypothetical protein